MKEKKKKPERMPADAGGLEVPEIVRAGHTVRRAARRARHRHEGVEISAIEIDGVQIRAEDLAALAGRSSGTLLTIEEDGEISETPSSAGRRSEEVRTDDAFYNTLAAAGLLDSLDQDRIHPDLLIEDSLFSSQKDSSLFESKEAASRSSLSKERPLSDPVSSRAARDPAPAFKSRQSRSLNEQQGQIVDLGRSKKSAPSRKPAEPDGAGSGAANRSDRPLNPLEDTLFDIDPEILEREIQDQVLLRSSKNASEKISASKSSQSQKSADQKTTDSAHSSKPGLKPSQKAAGKENTEEAQQEPLEDSAAGSSRWKRLLLNPGTWCLLLVGVSLVRLLWHMIRLSLFKLSLAGFLFGLGMMGMVLAGYWFFYTRSRWWQIPGILLCAGLMVLSVWGQNELSGISGAIHQMSDSFGPYVESVGLYAPASIPLSDPAVLNNETIGLIEGRNIPATQALMEDLESRGIHVKTRSFSTLQQLNQAVRGQSIRAAILTPADVRLIQEVDGTGAGNSQLSRVYSLSFPTGAAVPSSSKNLESDPYTVLISVSTDPIRETSYRSTLNLIVAVNPGTRRILTVVLPRNLYVGSSCQETLGCPPAETPDRLSFTSYHSIEALRKTLEDLFGIPIDFTVRIDLDRLLQLFDVNEAIRLSTDSPYTDVSGGTQVRMSGPQIKRYLGSLDDLSAENTGRQLNQLRVLLTLSHAYSHSGLVSLASSLEVLENSVQTSFSYEQLCQILRMFYLFPEHLERFYELITGTSASPYLPTLTESGEVVIADQKDLDHAKEAIETLLNGGIPQTTGLPDPAAVQPDSGSAGSEVPEPSFQTPQMSPS